MPAVFRTTATARPASDPPRRPATRRAGRRPAWRPAGWVSRGSRRSRSRATTARAARPERCRPAQTVERVIGHAGSVDPGGPQVVAPGDGGLDILELADRLPAVESRIANRHRGLPGHPALEQAHRPRVRRQTATWELTTTVLSTGSAKCSIGLVALRAIVDEQPLAPAAHPGRRRCGRSCIRETK